MSCNVLAHVPKSERNKFYDNVSKLRTANEADLPASRPVLCELTFEGRTVIEVIYAANSSHSAILGLAIIEALSLCSLLLTLKSLDNQNILLSNEFLCSKIDT